MVPQVMVTEPAPYRFQPVLGVVGGDLYFRQIPRGNVIFGGGHWPADPDFTDPLETADGRRQHRGRGRSRAYRPGSEAARHHPQLGPASTATPGDGSPMWVRRQRLRRVVPCLRLLRAWVSARARGVAGSWPS